jgi:hypothetical protein
MRKIIYFIFTILISSYCYANITCGDSEKLQNIEAKSLLHTQASKEARERIEKLVEKKMLFKYPSVLAGERGTNNLEQFHMGVIELFWCESQSMLLYRAWLLMYLNTSDYMFQ